MFYISIKYVDKFCKKKKSFVYANGVLYCIHVLYLSFPYNCFVNGQGNDSADCQYI